MKPAKGQIEVNLEELAALLERARQEPLDEEGYRNRKGQKHQSVCQTIGDRAIALRL